MKMAAARWIWLCNSSLYITITSPVSSRVSSLTDIRNMSRQKSESRTARVLVPPLTVVKHIVTEKGQTHPQKIPSHEVQFHIHCQTHIDISHNAALIMQSGWPWRRRPRLSHEIPWGLAVLRVDFLMMDTCKHVFVPGVVHESHTWFVWIAHVPNGKGCLFHPSPACFSPASQWLTNWTTLCKGYGFVKGKVVPWWRGIQRQDLFFYALRLQSSLSKSASERTLAWCKPGPLWSAGHR